MLGTKHLDSRHMSSYRRLTNSIWLFPLVLTLALVILTVLKISGTSSGIYYPLFYGSKVTFFDQPRSVRSDEWLVNTQLTVAQAHNNFQRVNKHIGNGQDMSVLLDVPTKDWSTFFKPHNWSFFVLPLAYAFALKWWFMLYLLILSCYFFTLQLLPHRKLFAILLSLSLAFSPFVQWWYQYSTIGTLYYSLFIALVVLKLFEPTSFRRSLVLSAILAYLLACFGLVLYPPFQIPCAIVLLAFSAGYVLPLLRKKNARPRQFLPQIILILGSLLAALAIIWLFVTTRDSVIHTIANTAYPGKRIVSSGGYNFAQYFSGNLDILLQSDARSVHYAPPGLSAVNQSEIASFISFTPLLLIPSTYLLFRQRKRLHRLDGSMVFIMLVSILFLAWLFIPHLSLLGEALLLNKVPLNRLIIGFCLLAVIYPVLWLRIEEKLENKVDSKASWGLFVVAYTSTTLLFYLYLGRLAHRVYPLFLSKQMALLAALPIPIALFLFMRKRFEWSMAVLLLFSVASTVHVNPFHHGIIDNTFPVAKVIQTTNHADPGVWASDSLIFENFPVMVGASSLSGVYAYPQLHLWEGLNQTNNSTVYNRYAHITFTFSESPTDAQPILSNPGADQFNINIPTCSPFLAQKHVKYLFTSHQLKGVSLDCVALLQRLNLPKATYYIYRYEP